MRRPPVKIGRAAWAALLLVASCTDTNIYHKTIEVNVPDLVTLSGSVCTDDPAQRQFPVRVMFLVDTYGEPQQQRQFAVEEVINRYVTSENYSFAIVRFAGEVKQLTPGYTQSLAQLREAAADLGFGAGACVSGQCRDWLGALSLASSIFTGDLLTTNPGTLSRTRYVFIFLASGPPDPALLTTGEGCDEKCRLVQAVEDMVEFGKEQGAAEVAFHTVQVDSIPGQCQGTADPRFCNSTTPCPANCAGTEECMLPQRLCADDHTVACSDNDGFCASLGLGACTAENLCDGDYATGCDEDAICAHHGVGRCEFPRVCSNDPTAISVRNEECCPTYVCDDPAGVENDRAASLLTSMAFRGSGKFLRFSLFAQMGFTALDFATNQSVFVKKAFMVTNINAKSIGGENLPDSDGDGMSDWEERCYGEMLAGECTYVMSCKCIEDVWSAANPLGTDTDPTLADTDEDGINDLLEMQFATVNLDPLRMDLPQACHGLEFPYKDRDGDTLNDCEEKLLGTDLSLFDSDRDGYPDMIEFRVGTNYLQPDHLKDTDMDGLKNGQELELHLDPQSNDMKARSGAAYRYRVIDEGLRIVPFVTQPGMLFPGLELTDVSGRSTNGAWTIHYYPAGSRREDGSVRDNPTMAWSDPSSGVPGSEVDIIGSGTYLVYAGCACVKDCAAECAADQWCNPNTGTCEPDQCERIFCAANEKCDSSSGRCLPDCTLSECDLGQSCDPLLGTCLTDRCLNLSCPAGMDCDPEAGVCTETPCQSWSCPDGMRLDENQKPAWVTVKVDESQLPLSGFWCDGSKDNEPCLTDSDCPQNTFCRIRESVVVGVANKNCISFKVKNVKLVETLETVPGFGAGYNNIFVYFAQTPLDNPYAYSIFRAALVTMKFLDGQKEPDWAEIPLGDGDFFAIQEK